jgi:hypothetical protein
VGDLVDRLVERLHLVLQVGADDAGADRAAGGLGGVAVPALEVGDGGHAGHGPMLTRTPRW